MSTQYPGGFITKSPPTPNGTSAKGMWTLSEQAGYRKQNIWPSVPGAPTIGTATATSGTAVSVAFTAPADPGSAAITSYTATSSPGGLTGTGSSSPVTVSGLTTGIAYTFTVTATNGAGTGPASAASNSVTPVPVTASFISNINSTTYDLTQPPSTAVDSAGNMYFGFGDYSNGGKPTVVKYDTTGAVVFQKQISVSGASLSNICLVVVDSSDNLFVAVRDSNYSDAMIIVKMTTAGAVVNANRAAASFGGSNARMAAFGTTLILAGRDSSSTGMCVFAYDTSSNSISWARRWYVSGSIYMDPTAIAESPNYYYVFGYTSTPNAFIFQFSKGGTINWGRTAATNGYAAAGTADSSDNPYIAIPVSFNGSVYIIKYDASYGPLGQAAPNTNSRYITIRNFAKDGSGNFYLCGDAYASPSNITSGYMAKMDTSLNVTQERTVFITGRPTSQNLYYHSNVVSNGNVFAVGQAFDGALTYNRYNSNISVPLDGSKTGNYTVNRYPSDTYTFQYQPYTATNGWSSFSGSTTGSFGSQPAAPSTSVTSVTASVSNLSLTVNNAAL
jgi:hypothetical protein